MNTDLIKKAFNALTEALSHYGLPTSSGRDRTGVAPDEFMLMNVRRDGSFAFKHAGTRNYLICSPKGELVIPMGGPFCKGVFDAY